MFTTIAMGALALLEGTQWDLLITWLVDLDKEDQIWSRSINN